MCLLQCTRVKARGHARHVRHEGTQGTQFGSLVNRIIKVRGFPGAAVKVMHSYIIPLISKQPDKTILQVSTTDAVIHYSGVMFKDTLNLKVYIIREKLLNCNPVRYYVQI